MNRRNKVVLSVVVALVATALGGWWWASRPWHPDVKTAVLDDAVAFIGTDDFNRLSASQRKKYSLAVTERLRERTFPQLVAMVTERRGRLKQIADNLKNSGCREDVEAAMLRVMLDKFYEEPAPKRAVYLWGLVQMQQRGATGNDGIGLPTAKQLQADLNRVLTRQPPRTVAQMSRFILDVQEQRKSMGLPDPY